MVGGDKGGIKGGRSHRTPALMGGARGGNGGGEWDGHRELGLEVERGGGSSSEGGGALVVQACARAGPCAQ